MKRRELRVRAGLRWLAGAGALLLAFAAGAQVKPLLPNIRSLPAGDLAIVSDLATGRPELQFSATTWNAGLGALELVAGEVGAGKQNVYQRIYNGDGTHADRLAGSFVWHDGHQHFHFEDYAVYSLQPLNSPGSSARTSQKTTFCVMDTGKVNGSLPGAPRKAVYASCGATVQGMSVGWGDTYGATLIGQSIDLSDWADGDYRLTIVADPQSRIAETDETDNTACLLLRLSISTKTVTPLQTSCGSGGGGSTVTVASVTPSSASVGATLGVTISGTGFTPGVAVAFENGSGAKPIVSNVVVQSATTITAVVTVKKGNTSGDTLWDLRVGTGVLANAFTVLP